MTIFRVLLGMLVLCGSAYAQPAGPANDLSAVATEDLIARLQDVSSEGIGTHETAWASGFMAIDEEPVFHGGIIGSAKPVVSPVMRELVRRGAAALPQLIKHLTDARPTKLTIGAGFMGKWFGREYDPKDWGSRKLPPGVIALGTSDDPESRREFDKYTLKVGDLCFVAVGQIVNRQFNAVRYQPSLCLVVNSPVETPALAAAVKEDWSGVTPADHQRSLEQDALSFSNPEVAPEALKRLLFYYPSAGNALAVQLLNRPFYDTKAVWDFFEKSLVPAKDGGEQDRLLAGFRKAHGEADYEGLEGCLIQATPLSQPATDAKRIRAKAVAEEVLQRSFPGFNPYAPPIIDAVDFYDQAELVDALAAFHSAEIDKAAAELLRRTAAANPTDVEGQFQQCSLAYACGKRFVRPEDRVKLDRAWQSLNFSSYPDDPKLVRKIYQGVQAFLHDLVAQVTPG